MRSKPNWTPECTDPMQLLGIVRSEAVSQRSPRPPVARYIGRKDTDRRILPGFRDAGDDYGYRAQVAALVCS